MHLETDSPAKHKHIIRTIPRCTENSEKTGVCRPENQWSGSTTPVDPARVGRCWVMIIKEEKCAGEESCCRYVLISDVQYLFLNYSCVLL